MRKLLPLVLFLPFLLLGTILYLSTQKGKTNIIYGTIKTNRPDLVRLKVYYTFNKGIIKNSLGDPSWSEYDNNLKLDEIGGFYFNSDIISQSKGKDIIIEQYDIFCQDNSKEDEGVIYIPSQHEYTLLCPPNN